MAADFGRSGDVRLLHLSMLLVRSLDVYLAADLVYLAADLVYRAADLWLQFILSNRICNQRAMACLHERSPLAVSSLSRRSVR